MRLWHVAAALAATGACATPGGRQLQGGEFVAVAVNDVAVSGRPPTLAFHDGERASGHGGCNSFSAAIDRGAEEGLRFREIAATEIACEPAATEQERRYFEILRAASGYSFYGDGSLSIIAADGRAIRFRRK
jgi:heat shock protein HslJ